jgi:hypothetical protein
LLIWIQALDFIGVVALPSPYIQVAELTVHHEGSNCLGSPQISGLKCTFHVEIKMSVPLNNLTPPLRPAGCQSFSPNKSKQVAPDPDTPATPQWDYSKASSLQQDHHSWVNPCLSRDLTEKTRVSFGPLRECPGSHDTGVVSCPAMSKTITGDCLIVTVCLPSV